jgi:hypothetical protein
MYNNWNIISFKLLEKYLNNPNTTTLVESYDFIMGKMKPDISVIKVNFYKQIYKEADIVKHILGIPIAFKDYTTESVYFHKA